MKKGKMEKKWKKNEKNMKKKMKKKININYYNDFSIKTIP